MRWRWWLFICDGVVHFVKFWLVLLLMAHRLVPMTLKKQWSR
jgi:hypothetical protein